MRRTFSASALLATLGLALGACGGDSGDSDTSGDAVSDTEDGVGVDEPADSDADEETGGDAANEGEQGDATAPWTDADLESLITTEIAGYEAIDPRVEFESGRVSYLETDPPGPVALEASVVLADCDPFICFDLDAEITDGQMESILSTLSRVHIDNPDRVTVVQNEELAPGATAFTTFFLSYVSEDGSKSSAHRFSAVHHDGTNHVLIQVQVPSAGFDSFEGIETAADLEAQMDRERALAVASDVFDAFADEFSTT